MKGYMKYRKGFKIQVDNHLYFQTDIRPVADIVTRFVDLNTAGVLNVKPGFACDGCSGPTIDTKSVLPG